MVSLSPSSRSSLIEKKEEEVYERDKEAEECEVFLFLELELYMYYNDWGN